MTESIRSIFEHNMKLIGALTKAVYYFREQEYEKALSLVADSMDKVKYVIQELIKNREYFNLVSAESVLQMLNELLDAKRSRDYILLADLMELQLISFLTGIQELLISKEEILFHEDNYKENVRLLLSRGLGAHKELMDDINTDKLLEKGYRIEYTSSGRMTLAAENEGIGFYFHTNNNPTQEAFLMAKHWYHPAIKRYILYGFGLGYHVGELHAFAKDAEVEVYEADRNVLKLACAFTDLKELFEDNRVRLIYDPELAGLKARIMGIAKDEVFYIHYPSYRNLRNKEQKEILNEIQPWMKAVQTY